MFSLEQRIDLARRVLKDVPNVEVRGYAGLTVDFARDNRHPRDRARAARRIGLRVRVSAGHDVAPSVRRRRNGVSHAPGTVHVYFSTLVREIATFGGDVSEFVHPLVAAELKKMKKAGTRSPRTDEETTEGSRREQIEPSVGLLSVRAAAPVAVGARGRSAQAASRGDRQRLSARE